jgi:hypothetical protein
MDQLIANVDQPNLDAAGAAKALTELKLALLDAQNAAAFGARALEAACGLSVRQKDKVALERALTQLMPYYGKTPNCASEGRTPAGLTPAQMNSSRSACCFSWSSPGSWTFSLRWSC